MAISLFHSWDYTATRTESAIILPEGCRDLIITRRPETGVIALRLTSLDTTPRTVEIHAGTSLAGYRLRPGTRLDLSDLKFDPSDLPTFGQQIKDRTIRDPDTAELIDALGDPNGTVETVARQQGVSPRTLQRQFKALALPPPGFWRMLARARRAALALSAHVSLCDIALEYQYSDQAHMTREFVRWFGRTPLQLRNTPDALHDLSHPGLGNWAD